MYKPTDCNTLENSIQQQIRLGIQGYGGTGKTYSAMGFKNPVVINVDRGLGVHIGRKDIIEVPLWDYDFRKKVMVDARQADNMKDCILKWIKTEGMKLEPDQTLVVDGSTGIQNAYHKYHSLNPVLTKGGKEDDYAEWRLKLVYFGDLCELFKQLKCDVIYIAHEADKKDKDGSYSGKIRPLISGSFGDQIMTHFTDWLRQSATAKPTDYSTLKDESLRKWGFEPGKTGQEQFKNMCDEFPRDTIYFWQTSSDEIFDGKCSSLVNYPMYIPATAKAFKSYMRPISK